MPLVNLLFIFLFHILFACCLFAVSDSLPLENHPSYIENHLSTIIGRIDVNNTDIGHFIYGKFV